MKKLIENKNKTEVQAFFDEIAEDYSSRYSSKRPYLRFFHQQRIRAALCEFDFSNKRIWDIGAGPASLKNALETNFNNVQYYASDISEKMFLNSNVPKEYYYIGEAKDAPNYFKDFSFVFMLGVTTYIDKNSFAALLRTTFKKRIKDKGQIIISFTNHNSLDYKIRSFVRKMKFIFPKNLFVLGQDFSTSAYSIDEVENLLASDYDVKKVVLLNQTLPFLNRLFPNIFIRFAKSWFKKENSSLKRYLSSDFIIIAQLKK